MASVKRLMILALATAGLVATPAAQQPGCEDPYLVGFADGEKAVRNDAVAYGACACIGTSLCMPIGCLPMGMAVAYDPSVSGRPRSNSLAYMNGYEAGMMSGQEKVQSARTDAAVVGFIGGALVFATLVPLVWMPMMFGD